jgi:hypothetical protein
MRRFTSLVIVVAGLAVPAGSAAACSFSAHLRAPTHHPKAGRKWPIRVTTSVKLDTTAYYAFLFSGRVVQTAEINPHSSAPGKKRFHFKGSFRDPTIVWPKRSEGFPLTFRVVLRNRCGTRHLDYVVTVHQ